MKATGNLGADMRLPFRSFIIVTAVAWFLSSAPLHAAVELPTGEYHQTTDDLIVKVLGGTTGVQRTWYEKQWHFMRAWNNLQLEYNAADGSVRSIERNRDRYERSRGNADVFVFDERMSIIRTDTGFRWHDREGNWIEYDAEGELIRYGDRNNVEVRFTYNGAGQRSGVFDHHGTQVLWYEYEGDRLTAAYDSSTPTPRRVEYRYTGSQLTEVIDVLGHSWRYEYDGNGRLKKAIDPDGRPTDITYTAGGRVASVLRADGTGTRYQYDYTPSKREYYTYQKSSGGRIEEVWYNREGEIIRRDINASTVLAVAIGARRWVSTNELDHQTIREYDEWDNLIRITHPDRSTKTFTIDPSYSNVLEETNENGVLTRHEYDARGNLIRSAEAVERAPQRTTEYRYDEWGQLIEETRLGDAVTDAATVRMTYDDLGNLKTYTDGEGHVTEYLAHDALGNVLQMKDARGNLWTYEYDATGNLTRETTPLGFVTVFDYDKVGNLTTITDAHLKQTRIGYDVRNRPVSFTDPLNDTSKLGYNDRNQLTSFTDALGHVTRFDYNRNGQLSRTTDPSGDAVTLDYGTGTLQESLAGLVNAINYPTYKQTFTYDKRYRPIRSRDTSEDTMSRTTAFSYDAVGNVKTLTDPQTRVMELDYDALNRLITILSTTQASTRLQYDNRDNLVQVTNAHGHAIRRYEYDRNNRLLKELLPDNVALTSSYDPNGNLEQTVDAKGQVANYRSDADNRLSQVQYFTDLASAADPANAKKTVAFSYDKLNRLTRYDDGRTEGTYDYDDAGRLTRSTVDYGSFRLSQTYTYYPSGLKKTYTGPDNITHTYRYNAGGELQSITIPQRGSYTVNQYKWGVSERVTLPGGGQQLADFDGYLRPTRLRGLDPAGNSILNHLYTHDTVDNITTRTTLAGLYQYDYDGAARLAGVESTIRDTSTTTQTYTYDSAGNRSTDSDHTDSDGTAHIWIYDERDRLQRRGPIVYDYDSNGSRIRRSNSDTGEVVNYVYDLENRLIEMRDQNNAVIAAYTHDPFGRRLSKTAAGTTTYYFYSQEGLVAEANAGGVVSTTYGYQPNSVWSTNPLFIKQGDQFGYYINDHLGTPHRIVAANGAVLWSAIYDAFGAATVTESGVTNNLRFPGQYYDRETGLHQNYFRDYDPSIGQYIQSDPIGLGAGPNAYSYALQNPVRYADPTGEYVFHLGGAIFGALSGGVGAYISSGGDLGSAFKGALIGGAIGLVNPLSGYLGAFSTGVVSSTLGQASGVCWDPREIDYTLALASGVAGVSGSALTRYLVNPRRSAFTFHVNRTFGPPSPFAQGISSAVIEGTIGGVFDRLAEPRRRRRSNCEC
ncbi:MAG: RHS repeat-associated core domain-containing protein [Gammaproteobacteria bacterium]